MSEDTGLALLRKVLEGLKVSGEYKYHFGDFPSYVNTIKQFYRGGVAAYQGSHYRLEDVRLPESTLCFSCHIKEWDRDAEQRERTDSLLNEIGIRPAISEEQQKVDALLNHYGIEHSFIPMREHGEEKMYHSVLVAMDANQPEFLEKLTKLYEEKAHAPLTKAQARKTSNERLKAAMQNYAAAAAYERPYYIPTLYIFGEDHDDYAILTSHTESNNTPPKLRDELGNFLIEAGLKRLAPSPQDGWRPDSYHFGKLTSEQLAIATAKIEYETTEITGHKTAGQLNGSLLTPAFDKECEGRGDTRTLQTLLGMIEASQTIPANMRRRLVTSITSELNTREIE